MFTPVLLARALSFVLTKITRRRRGLRFWLSSFLLRRRSFSIGKGGREREIDEKERACDNTYSISIWKRQQADSSNSEEEKKKTTTKEKLYYPIERTRAWSGWLNTYRRSMYIEQWQVALICFYQEGENCSGASIKTLELLAVVSRQKRKVMRKMWVSICIACDDSWWMWCIHVRVKSPANNT